MNELLRIEQELQQILEVGKQKEAKYMAEVKTAQINEQEANRAVIKAKQGEDAGAYAKAIADKRTASDVAGYYEGKVAEMKDKPYITEAEYEKYTKQIKAEMDRLNNAGKTKASRLFKELDAIKEEVFPAFAKTNELLSKLQNNIYKSTYEKQMADAKENGTPFNSSRAHNKYDDNSLIMGIDFILNSAPAKTIAGQRGECK